MVYIIHLKVLNNVTLYDKKLNIEMERILVQTTKRRS